MSKYRPYTEKDMTAVHLCAVRYKGTTAVNTVIGWDDKNVYITNVQPEWFTYQDFLDKFTFLDGSHCGIEENDVQIN